MPSSAENQSAQQDLFGEFFWSHNIRRGLFYAYVYPIPNVLGFSRSKKIKIVKREPSFRIAMLNITVLIRGPNPLLWIFL